VIEALTSEPMHMATQGIGQVGVPFFFLVSGFVVTPIALRQGQGRFALNRLIRVYLPMMFVVALTAILLVTSLQPPSTGQSQELSPLTLFTNVTLSNYLIYPQVVLIPVAWTMIIEVIFYLMLIVLIPVLRRSVWLTIAIELTLVFVVLMSRSELNASYSLLAVNVSYLPIMIIGQTVWAVTSKRVPLWLGGVFGGVAWALYVLADIVDVGRVDDSYNLALAFAVVCFLMGMFAEPKLRQRRIWTELSERSYSLYLLHMTVSFVLLQLMRPAVPLPIALLIAIVGTFAVVEISYRFVERPSHTLARKLSGKRTPKPRGGLPAPPDSPSPVGRSPVRRVAEIGANEVTTELPKVGNLPAGPARPRPAPRPGSRPVRPQRGHHRENRRQ
jgi:peptidoglycan/LPS O-acetylase OafA/YrhL